MVDFSLDEKVAGAGLAFAGLLSFSISALQGFEGIGGAFEILTLVGIPVASILSGFYVYREEQGNNLFSILMPLLVAFSAILAISQGVSAALHLRVFSALAILISGVVFLAGLVDIGEEFF